MICPLLRSTQWLNPSKSASTANSPRLFRSTQTVDFPTPELPVTQTNGIDESSHGGPWPSRIWTEHLSGTGKGWSAEVEDIGAAPRRAAREPNSELASGHGVVPTSPSKR